ncbi:MAG: hypothetical protein K0R47_3295, partial [Brevibacillus sp.]|nr:hypothetical protein [Brevibacillus sp.]
KLINFLIETAREPSVLGMSSHLLDKGSNLKKDQSFH